MVDGDEYDIDPEIMNKAETSYKERTNKTTAAMTTMETDTTGSKIDILRPEIVSNVTEKEQQSWFYDTPGILNENQVGQK